MGPRPWEGREGTDLAPPNGHRRKKWFHFANRRRIAPRGLAGGGDAQPGRNWVERIDGSIEPLSATQSAEMQVGDRFIIHTPGGGGFGKEPA